MFMDADNRFLGPAGYQGETSNETTSNNEKPRQMNSGARSNTKFSFKVNLHSIRFSSVFFTFLLFLEKVCAVLSAFL